MHTVEGELGCCVSVAGSPGVPTSLSRLLVGHITQAPRAEPLACGPGSGGEWAPCLDQPSPRRFEQAFVSSLIYSWDGEYFWTALQDLNSTGSFRWLSGDEVMYTHWNRDQPGEPLPRGPWPAPFFDWPQWTCAARTETQGFLVN